MSQNQKVLLRWVCLVLAGFVSTLLAHTHSFAQSGDTASRPDTAACSSLDYIDYQTSLKTEPVEGAPEEYLRLAEAFLNRCSARPEAGRVALQAARNSLDTGDADKALIYFSLARARFAVFGQQARMDYMTTLILNGQQALAWNLRDLEVEVWLDQLAEDGLASVETIRARDGMIYKVTYDAVHPVRQERLAWLAVPFGAGFPAILSLSSDQELTALMTLRAGEAASGLQQLTLRRCHGRDTLASKLDGIREEDAHANALKHAKAYLARPDSVRPRAPGRPIATCYHVDRLFLAPDPKTALSLY